MDPASKQLWKSMWAVFDHIKDFKFQGRQIGDPFVKLPNKSIYPDYYEGIFKIYYFQLKRKKEKLVKVKFLFSAEQCGEQWWANEVPNETGFRRVSRAE